MWIPTRFKFPLDIPDPAPRHYPSSITVDFDGWRWNVDVEIYSDTGSGGITTVSHHWFQWAVRWPRGNVCYESPPWAYNLS